MKIKRLPLLIVSALSFSLLLLTAGCSKSTTPPLPTNGTLTATTGSTNFSGAQVESVYSQYLASVAVLGYTIQSTDTTGIQLQFAYMPPVGLTFSSDTTETGLTYFTGGKRYDAYTAVGRVIMSLSVADTVGHKLTGSFSGTIYNDANANDSMVVTNGKFSCTYSVQP